MIHNERNLGFAAACNQGFAQRGGREARRARQRHDRPPRLALRSGDPSRRLRDRARRADDQLRRWERAGSRRLPNLRGDAGLRPQAQPRSRGRCADGLRPRWRCSARRSAAMCGRRSVASTNGSRTGIFEDDYENQVRATGHRVVCANDVFVHRFGGGFATSGATDSEPAAMARGIEEAVQRHVPEGSTVLVVSGGDEALADFDGIRGLALPAARRWWRRGPPSDRRGSDRRAGASSRAGRRLPRGSGDGAFVARTPRGIPAPPGALRAPVRRP